MQKVIRRTLLAKRQAARRNAVRAGKSSSDARELRKMGLKRISQSLRADTQAARVARREDWLLGPLAPRRDAGDAREAYGAVDTVRMQSVEKVKGTWRRWGIVEGDRVVIVQEGHRERGFIGIVSEVREKSEDCIVRGLNKVGFSLGVRVDGDGRAADGRQGRRADSGAYAGEGSGQDAVPSV
jgi:large subunit ribosomal protein L24